MDRIDHSFSVLSLSQIKDTGTFDIHPYLRGNSPANGLYRSIEFSGIISPPIVTTVGNDNFEIICGRQRLQCLKLLNQQQCSFRILPKQISNEDILSLVLEDQFIVGALNIVEQACFLKLCFHHFPEKNRFHAFIESLPPGRITKGFRFLTPLAEIDENLQLGIHSGFISENIITDLLSFEKADQLEFISLLQTLGIGKNNQKKLIVQLNDILKREKIRLHQLVDQEQFARILGDEKRGKPDKASAVFRLIQCLHQPRLSAARDDFKERIKSAKLPANCNLSPSQSFETKEVKLTIAFENYEKFLKKWDPIKQVIKEG